jgi:parallel beta-helix repeat protein
MRKFIKMGLVIGSAMASTAMFGSGVASASMNTAYVAPNGSSHNADNSCRTAGFRSINSAIGAVGAGGTVVVCKGTYHTQAVIKKSLALIGRPGAVINAQGQKPVPGLPVPGGSGIVVLGAHHVLVSGFVVTAAKFDAILVARSTNVKVADNLLEHNGDVGVDFNGTSYSLATRNLSRYNGGGGFLVADDLGRSTADAVTSNFATRNPGGCGVILAGHSTAGVTKIFVGHNLLTYNGTNKKMPGAGVVIASEVKNATVAENTVYENKIYGNGLAGVTIHSHVAGQDLNGNKIVSNDIGTNNTVGDTIGLGAPVTNRPDLRTTGILVGASSKVHVLIANNYIHDNHYGIFIEGRVNPTLQNNRFRNVTVQVNII